MSENIRSAASASSSPVLSDGEAGRRMLLLADLQAALATLGVQCVLARNHRLVLRCSDGPYEPSGLTQPTLHIFTPQGTRIAAIDGRLYVLSNGQECPAGDPGAAAAVIARDACAVASPA